MIDVALVRVKAGKGGDGCVSFRREKYVPKGGPDGGDGGDGGSVVLVGDRHLRTLDYFAGKQRFEARSGERGRKQKQTGASREDLEIPVPQGCSVYEIDGLDEVQVGRKRLYEILRDNKVGLPLIHNQVDNLKQQVLSDKSQTNPKSNIQNSKQYLDPKFKYQNEDENLIPGYTRSVGGQAPRSRDLELQYLGEVMEGGEELVVARGGKGGRGNTAFKSSRNTTPREAEEGEVGEERWLVLELKLLADVGLVGLPNVGKSTLLSVLTAARPKIADYEFTTLEPNLGVLRLSTKHEARNPKQISNSKIQISKQGQSSKSKYQNRELVIADIPGLIEGASEGKGLGDEFLRHVERCGLLVHVLAPRLDQLSEPENQKSKIKNQNGKSKIKSSIAGVVEQMVGDYETVRRELRGYHPDLMEKREVMVVNKMDLLPADQVTSYKEQVTRAFGEMGVREVVFVSGATHQGIKTLEDLLCKSQG